MAEDSAAASTSRLGISQMGRVPDESPASWAPDDEEKPPSPPFPNWTEEMFIGMYEPSEIIWG